MSIKSDKWIRRMSESEGGMIEPFEAGQVRVDSDNQRIVSYGTSSYGYDVRCADEFKIFTNINHAIVDPKAFDPDSFVDLKSDVCIIPPNSFALARTIEYFRIPRNVLTVCLGKSTYARCFSADTLVALTNGLSVSLEQMVVGAESGERFYGYGVSQFGQITVQELEAPRLVGQDSLVEVTLDNGEVIRATPDHEFMMRDGSMCPAAELAADSSLMPLYRSLQHGNEMTFQPTTGQMVSTRVMAEQRISMQKVDSHSEHLTRNSQVSTRPSLAELRDNDKRYADYRAQASKHVRRLSPSSDLDTGVNIDNLAFILPTTNAIAGHVTPISNHKVTNVRHVAGSHDVYCLTAPDTGNFALEAGVFVSNCGIIVNVTPLEPEWEGHVTLEFSNTTPLPAKIYANEGVAQMLFFESDEVCETSYADRGGKYQGQRGVTLPRT